MKYKVKIHTYDYFKEHNYVKGEMVKKYEGSKDWSWVVEEHCGKIYDVVKRFPGPYTIQISDEYLRSYGAGYKEVQVISWMIDEVYNDKENVEYFM